MAEIQFKLNVKVCYIFLAPQSKVYAGLLSTFCGADNNYFCQNKKECEEGSDQISLMIT